MLWSPSSPSTNTVTATNIIINTTILQYPMPCEAMVSLDCVHPEVTQCGRRGFKMWALTEVQSPGEIKRREVELDSHSLMDCLAAELFLISCFEHCLCDFVLHSCWNSNRHAFVGGTVSRWARWRIPINKRQKKQTLTADQTLTACGECADQIVGYPSW